MYEVIDLGHQPPSDAFLSEEELNESKIFYPLKVFFCEDCKLVQLSYAVDPKILFTDKYVYTSASNKPLLAHMKSLAERFTKDLGLSGRDLVVDIASNDGALLKEFEEHNVRILGVDPSSVADIAIKNKIPTIKDFFNEALAKSILSDHGKAKLITGLSLIPHAKELVSIISGVKILLDHKGVFLAESHYLADMIEKLQYDAIYHEHLRYYSVTSLVNLFSRFGMEVFHAERIPTHGGSIRVLACKKGDYPVSDSVKFLLKEEEKSNLNSKDSFDNFRKKVNDNKRKLNAILHDIKSKGHRIVGIGAPAKGTTLLNFCKIDSSKLDYLAETSELKIGKYSPGMHIRILSEARLFEDNPGYALLLPWNIKENIIPKLREKGYMGKIIIPNPEPQIIDERDGFYKKDLSSTEMASIDKNSVVKIKPVHEDERGKIIDVVDGIDFVHAGIVTYKKGAVRGNHYHKKTEQLNYVLNGKIRHLSKDLSKKNSKVKEVILEAGDMINNPPYEWHSDEGLDEENELLFFTKKARGGSGYENDVFRVSREEIRDFELDEK
jgi:quercetin dioxygenase-like cupin family protein